MMKPTLFARSFGAVVVAALTVPSAAGHPGSGIVVDDAGTVYFVDTGVNSALGLWKIDPKGELSRVRGPHNHWLSLDRRSNLARVSLPDGVEAVENDPTLVVSGDFPMTVGADGALYFPQPAEDGRVRIMRLLPPAKAALHATLPIAKEIGADGKEAVAPWIHGIAAGPDGAIYCAQQRAIRKISPEGVVSTLVDNVKVADCHRPAGATEERLGPALRGLAVAADGAVYVAASACSAVLRITAEGEATVVLRSDDSWSPTGVAIHGDDVYVLEYLHTDTNRREDWLPRLRKISADGEVTLIAEVTQELRRKTEKR
jgi:hypothetical protein